MRITLTNGPLGGEEFGITQRVWESGRVRIPERFPIIPGSFYFNDEPRIFDYERRRVMPAWAGFCAMPVYEWHYIGRDR